MKIKLENMMNISAITNEEESAELEIKLQELESKYLYSKNPSLVAVMGDYNYAANGYREIANVYYSYKHLSRVWHLKSSMALIFATGSDRENIYLQCARRTIANIHNDASLTEEIKIKSIVPAIISFTKSTEMLQRTETQVQVFRIAVATFPRSDTLMFFYADRLILHKKYFEATTVLTMLYCKKKLIPYKKEISSKKCTEKSWLTHSSLFRKDLYDRLDVLSRYLCCIAEKLEAEGDHLSFSNHAAEGKAKYKEACKLFREAAKCASDKLHPNECWFYAQLKKHPDTIIVEQPGKPPAIGNVKSNDEITLCSFIELQAVEFMKAGMGIRHVVLSTPKIWGVV